MLTLLEEVDLDCRVAFVQRGFASVFILLQTAVAVVGRDAPAELELAGVGAQLAALLAAEKLIYRRIIVLAPDVPYAAASIANELLDRNYRVWMVSTVNLLDRMFDEADIIRNRLATFELVVLDDFGAERNTEYASEKMFQIIDDRMRSRLPTIITTNIDITKPTENLTYQRIFSRLNGEAPQFRCKGGDLRADRGREKRQLANEILKG